LYSHGILDRKLGLKLMPQKDPMLAELSRSDSMSRKDSGIPVDLYTDVEARYLRKPKYSRPCSSGLTRSKAEEKLDVLEIIGKPSDRF
jgi:hypothetical protein